MAVTYSCINLLYNLTYLISELFCVNNNYDELTLTITNLQVITDDCIPYVQCQSCIFALVQYAVIKPVLK